MPNSRIIAALTALAVSAAALPAFAQGNQVTPLDVTAKAPTSIAVQIRGRDQAAVRHDIRVAADTVCSNAVDNRDISFVDRGWCADRAADKANHQYAAYVRTFAFAASGYIVLSAR